MASITIVKPCRVTLDDGTVHEIPAGVYTDLPDHIADHWYVQHHSDNPPARPAVPGTQEHAEMMAQRAARERLLKAAEDQQVEDARIAARSSNRRRPARTDGPVVDANQLAPAKTVARGYTVDPESTEIPVSEGSAADPVVHQPDDESDLGEDTENAETEGEDEGESGNDEGSSEGDESSEETTTPRRRPRRR